MALSTPFSGHDPALPTVTRRSLLRATPGAALGLLPAQATAEADTPVLRLFREWDAAEADVNDRDELMADDDLDVAVAGICSLKEHIKAKPVTRLTDLAAKLIVSTVWSDFGSSKTLTAECEAILAGGAA